jgi:hypothetical protein
MFNASTEFPALWGALLVLNWPVYAFVYRQIFSSRRDVKLSVLAALKPSVFWKDSEPWSAGKAFSFLLICGLIVAFEYALLSALLSQVLT